jgi:hypothetical protein
MGRIVRMTRRRGTGRGTGHGPEAHTRPLRVRVRTDLAVALMDLNSGADLVGRARNLSLGGLYVEAEAQLPVGAHLVVCLDVGAEAASPDAYLTAEVVHLHGDGMGLRFLGASPAAAEAVAALVERSGCYRLRVAA